MMKNVVFKTREAVANNSGAMGAETISLVLYEVQAKNGRSMKSHTSKRNLKKKHKMEYGSFKEFNIFEKLSAYNKQTENNGHEVFAAKGEDCCCDRCCRCCDVIEYIFDPDTECDSDCCCLSFPKNCCINICCKG